MLKSYTTQDFAAARANANPKAVARTAFINKCFTVVTGVVLASAMLTVGYMGMTTEPLPAWEPAQKTEVELAIESGDVGQVITATAQAKEGL